MLKKVLALSLTSAIVLSAFAGCGKDDEPAETTTDNKSSDTTKVSESEKNDNSESQKEFTIVCLAGGTTNPIVPDRWIWKEYEEMTGVHINWVEVPESAINDRKNLIMNSEDRPDAFWQVGWSTDELMSYGSEGAFVNIAPYLDSDAPNLKKLLSEDIEGGLAACTMPDGGIYSMPWVMTDLPQENVRFYLNKTWLKNLGLETPETVDELTNVFKEFKTKDANGNGNTEDEYPIYMQPSGISMLQEMLCGSYGIGNNGFKPIAEGYYIDKDNKVQSIFTSEGMKQMWSQMADWWKDGYFYPETFGTYEYEQWVTDGSVNDVVGMYGWGDAAFLYSDASKNYVGINALKGPNGDQIQSWCDFPVRNIATFTITDACKDPQALIRWADYFYGDEGTQFAAYGTEGKTYTKDEDGNIRYVDDILNYDGGAQLGAWQYGFFVFGGNFPWKSFDSKTMEIARRQDSPDYVGEKFSEYAADSEKYKADLMPGLTPTVEEAKQISALKTDMDKYTEEARMNFVTGVWNFEGDWDTYVTQLEKMGLNDYITIKQAQYERYLENNK